MKHTGRVVKVGCLLILNVSLVFAQNKPPSFSGDYIFTDNGSKPETGKIYFSWPYVRMDSEGGIFFITNYSTKIKYAIISDKHIYSESPALEYALDSQAPCSKRPDITCKKIGKETVNGRKCDKWETRDKSGSTGYQWIDQKLGFPIRAQNQNGTNMEYKNIKVEPQAASLFEIPVGYRKVKIF